MFNAIALSNSQSESQRRFSKQVPHPSLSDQFSVPTDEGNLSLREETMKGFEPSHSLIAVTIAFLFQYPPQYGHGNSLIDNTQGEDL
ncbi:MAG: hypothetical protein J7545_19890 [Roseofilum sp. SBFL]|uniref:hypothetical protein n=1 Tax=unclassified Roseofilum TaxID=2620099 RepID=UPI001B04EFBF|nr:MULTISPECIES: hypothetical protein [unclassified Roseofilum]MBP0026142.1 hypothetical protein [Roseofilum sp. SID2]MBP0036892.1 hypothetical protein [Roseofilum sp. SID1]MBP0044206.1 hypothetical protein [Roseofilum sp. SBFL]